MRHHFQNTFPELPDIINISSKEKHFSIKRTNINIKIRFLYRCYRSCDHMVTEVLVCERPAWGRPPGWWKLSGAGDGSHHCLPVALPPWHLTASSRGAVSHCIYCIKAKSRAAATAALWERQLHKADTVWSGGGSWSPLFYASHSWWFMRLNCGGAGERELLLIQQQVRRLVVCLHHRRSPPSTLALMKRIICRE